MENSRTVAGVEMTISHDLRYSFTHPVDKGLFILHSGLSLLFFGPVSLGIRVD
jgi:hypothetical protein